MGKNSRLPLSLCMIVKNEADFLEISLSSVKAAGVFDEIVVADTGSLDASKEIALSFGAKVYDFVWCDDFSAARNFAADKASRDWVFMLDADEEITSISGSELTEFMKDTSAAGFAARVELTDNAVNYETRLYNKRVNHYKGTIHEQIVPIDPGAANIIKNAPIRLLHHGYLPEYNRTMERLARNETMLLKSLCESPDDPYILYQLGKSYFCAGRDLSKACEYFEMSLDLKPNPDLAYVYNMVECYGYALINTGQAKKALKLRSRYRLYYNSNPQFRFLSGHIFQENGMLPEAVECYESCIGADAIDYRGITGHMAYYNIGVILEVIGMTEEAKGMYKQCGEYEPAKARLEILTK